MAKKEKIQKSKHGKKFEAAKLLVETGKVYEINEAVALAKKVSYAKFWWSLELCIKTFADPKYNDQMMRGTIILPHGTGKTVRVGVFVSDDKVEEALKLGADRAGSTDLIKDIESGKVEFDVLVTTVDMVKDLAKVAKILWPKGLMPSAKTGTITNNLATAIDEIKKWRIEYKLDKTGNIQLWVGKLSFSDTQLIENVQMVLKTLEENKPAAIKGRIMKKVVIAPTMWPGILIG